MKYDDTNEPMQRINEIDGLRAKADNLEEQWLRERGWKYTSSTPGCYWMWIRDGFMVDTETAARIQKWNDSGRENELHPERFEECLDKA